MVAMRFWFVLLHASYGMLHITPPEGAATVAVDPSGQVELQMRSNQQPRAPPHAAGSPDLESPDLESWEGSSLLQSTEKMTKEQIKTRMATLLNVVELAKKVSRVDLATVTRNQAFAAMQAKKTGADPDSPFTVMELIEKANQAIREMEADGAVKLNAILAEYNSEFDTLVAANQDGYNVAAMAHQDNLGSWETMKFQLDADVKAILPIVKKVFTRFMANTQQVHKAAVDILAKFESKVVTDQTKWSKEEVAWFSFVMGELGDVQTGMYKNFATTAKETAKEETAQDKRIGKTFQTIDKTEKKGQKQMDKMEGKLTAAEDEMENMEDAMEVKDTEGEHIYEKLADNDDPEQLGIYTVEENKDETLGEFRSDANDAISELEDHLEYKMQDLVDKLEEIKDSGIEYFAAGQEKMHEMASAEIDNLGFPVVQFEKSNVHQQDQLKKVAVVAKMAAVKTGQSIEGTGQYTTQELENVDVVLDKTMTYLDKTLQEGVLHTQRDLEGKALTSDAYLHSLFQELATDGMAKNSRVVNTATGALASTSMWIASKLGVALGQMTMGTETVKKLQKHDEKTKKLIDGFNDVISQLRGCVPSIKNTNDNMLNKGAAAVTSTYATSKATEAKIQESGRRANEGIGIALKDKSDELEVTTKSLNDMLSGTTGAAMERLEAQSNLNQQGQRDLRLKVFQAYLNIEAVTDLSNYILKTMEHLRLTVPEEASNIAGELNDQGFAVEQMLHDTVDISAETIDDQARQNTKYYEDLIEEVAGKTKNSNARIQKGIVRLVANLGAAGKLDKKVVKEMLERHFVLDNHLTRTMSDVWSAEANENKDWDDINSTIKGQLREFGYLEDQVESSRGNISRDTKTEMKTVTMNYRNLLSSVISQYGTKYTDIMKSMDESLQAGKTQIKKLQMADKSSFEQGINVLANHLAAAAEKHKQFAQMLVRSSNPEDLQDSIAKLKDAEESEAIVADLIRETRKESHKIAADASAAIGNAEGQNDEQRKSLQETIVKGLTAIKTNSAAAASELRDHIRQEEQDLDARAQQKVQQAKRENEAMMAEETEIKMMGLGIERKTKDATKKADVESAQMKLKEDASKAKAQQDIQEENLDADKVKMEMSKVSGDVQGSLDRAQAEGQKYMEARLQPSDKESLINSLTHHLLANMKGETEMTSALTTKAAALATELADRVDKSSSAQISDAARLEKLVAKEEMRQQGYFEDLDEQSREMHGDIFDVGGDLSDLVTEMALHLQNKAADISSDMSDMETQVDEMVDMQKYQSADALKRVYDTVVIANDQAVDIEAIKNKVKANSKGLRTRFNQVFYDLGMELDMAGVAQRANETMAEEESMRSKLASGREAIEEMMEAVNREMQANLTRIFNEAKLEMQRINRMDHLSAQEKQARIDAVKRKMGSDMRQIQAKGSSMIDRQRKALLGIDEKKNSVESLLARATALAQGAHDITPRKKLQEELEAIKETGTKIMNEHASAFSLLEDGEHQDVELRADEVAAERLAHRYGMRHGPPHERLAHVAEDLKHLNSQRTEEAEDWEAQLRAFGAVLPS